MKLIDLYTRVVETTGLDIVTLNSLQTAVSNCFADMTSRGYKTFKEVNFETLKECRHTLFPGMLRFAQPKDIRKNLYIRLFFQNGAVVATRYSLTNKRVGCMFVDGVFKSMLEQGQAIYYIKGDEIVIEWDPKLGFPTDMSYAYYQRLVAPKINNDINDVDQLNSIELDIREEFEDAVVFYAAYFYYSRFQKDTDKIQLYLSQYKYYMEDITHELAYEDDFNEEDTVIKVEYE